MSEPKKATQDVPRDVDQQIEFAFWADDFIPDAASAFRQTVQPIEDAIKTADIVLDTNVLLLPYGAGSSSLEEIIRVFNALAKKKQLFLPAQAAREFIRNRPNKLAELQQQMLDKTSRYVAIDKLSIPVLENTPAYNELNEALEKTSTLKKELNKASAGVVDAIRAWEWNDPVNHEYRRVFTADTIIQPTIDRAATLTALQRRYRLKIPPGYKDSSKDDYGIGDFLIWLTILEIGAKNKKPLIFVSGDGKPDWQHRSGSNPYLPRYELLDEYRRGSDGQAFFIIPLSKLLELLKAESTSVKEIKKEEERLQEAIAIEVECPYCQSQVHWRLAQHIGATAHPRCSNCHGAFHIHRTKTGVTIRRENENQYREAETDALLPEQVACPACEEIIMVELSAQKNATAWWQCVNCRTIFPIHRKADGGVLVSQSHRDV